MDYTITQYYLDSDHKLLYADLTFAADTTPPDTTPIPPKINYHLLTQILVKMNNLREDNNDPWYMYDASTPTPPTKKTQSDQTILADAHDIATTDTTTLTACTDER